MNHSLKYFEVGMLYSSTNRWRVNQKVSYYTNIALDGTISYYTNIALGGTIAIAFGEPMLCVGAVEPFSSPLKDGSNNTYAVFLTRTPLGESVEVIAGDALHVFENFEKICG